MKYKPKENIRIGNVESKDLFKQTFGYDIDANSEDTSKDNSEDTSKDVLLVEMENNKSVVNPKKRTNSRAKRKVNSRVKRRAKKSTKWYHSEEDKLMLESIKEALCLNTNTSAVDFAVRTLYMQLK